MKYTLDEQAEKLNNVLSILDCLVTSGFKFQSEIEILEHIQDLIFKKIEKRELKKKGD